MARQTEHAGKQYHRDVVTRAHQAASLAAERTGALAAPAQTSERDRSIAYLQTFLDVVRAGRAEIAAYKPVLEKMLDVADLVMAGLREIERSAGSVLDAARHGLSDGSPAAQSSGLRDSA